MGATEESACGFPLICLGGVSGGEEECGEGRVGGICQGFEERGESVRVIGADGEEDLEDGVLDGGEGGFEFVGVPLHAVAVVVFGAGIEEHEGERREVREPLRRECEGLDERRAAAHLGEEVFG